MILGIEILEPSLNRSLVDTSQRCTVRIPVKRGRDVYLRSFFVYALAGQYLEGGLLRALRTTESMFATEGLTDLPNNYFSRPPSGSWVLYRVHTGEGSFQFVADLDTLGDIRDTRLGENTFRLSQEWFFENLVRDDEDGGLVYVGPGSLGCLYVEVPEGKTLHFTGLFSVGTLHVEGDCTLHDLAKCATLYISQSSLESLPCLMKCENMVLNRCLLLVAAPKLKSAPKGIDMIGTPLLGLPSLADSPVFYRAKDSDPPARIEPALIRAMAHQYWRVDMRTAVRDLGDAPHDLVVKYLEYILDGGPDLQHILGPRVPPVTVTRNLI